MRDVLRSRHCVQHGDGLRRSNHTRKRSNAVTDDHNGLYVSCCPTLEHPSRLRPRRPCQRGLALVDIFATRHNCWPRLLSPSLRSSGLIAACDGLGPPALPPSEQLDVEQQRGVGRDHAARPPRAVAQLGRDQQRPFAALLPPDTRSSSVPEHAHGGPRMRGSAATQAVLAVACSGWQQGCIRSSVQHHTK